MAGEFSRLGKQRGADAADGRVSVSTYTPYIALCSTAPTDSALGGEYTATGYARQPVTFSAPTAADPPVASNSGALTFGPFTANTGATLSYTMLMDGVSGGTATANMYVWWTLTTPKTPANGDSATVATGAITLSYTV
ncbi:MAG: hypothetical protein ABR532_08970 [Candidatus Dormibacteria bacterium]